MYLPRIPYFLEVKGGFAWGALPIIFFYSVLACEIYRFETGDLFNEQHQASVNIKRRALSSQKKR
jgi:hypothetical protein